MESLEKNDHREGEFKKLYESINLSLVSSTVSSILDEGVRQFAENYLFKNFSYNKEDKKVVRKEMELLKQARLTVSEDYVILEKRLRELEEIERQYKGQQELKQFLNTVLTVNPDAIFVTLDSFSKYIDEDDKSQLSSSFNYRGRVPKKLIGLLSNLYKSMESKGALDEKLNRRIIPKKDAYIYDILLVIDYPNEKYESLDETILKKCSVFFADGNYDTLEGLLDHPILSTKKYIGQKYIKEHPKLKIKRAAFGVNKNQVLILTNSRHVIPFNIFPEGIIIHGVFEKED